METIELEAKLKICEEERLHYRKVANEAMEESKALKERIEKLLQVFWCF